MLDGTETAAMSHKDRARRIAYLPQQLSPARMDILTLASHGRFARMSFSKVMGEEDKKAVRRALERTGLWQARYRRVDTLSGGERQRAYLAMILAQDAEYMLLDEPAAALDIAHQIETMDLLKELASEGRGIVITSHDLPQTAAYSDRICLIDRGRADSAVPPDQLIREGKRIRQVMGMTLVPADKGLYPYILEA